MKFTASTFVDINSKWLELGTFTGTRAQAAKQAMAKIPADFPATELLLNEVGTDSQAEYVHRIQGKRAVPFVKRWYGKNDEEREFYYNQRVTMQMVHGVLVVGLPQ
ncbi:MAG: hypothetical protein WAM58_16255 [Candidatus Acidiferrum sp.]